MEILIRENNNCKNHEFIIKHEAKYIVKSVLFKIAHKFRD